ncbi:MAG TPA: SDR family oxidoreductase [Steroidobacter sp.]|jgi:NAD(P)-dependent dehydrogenase (short-subunit alcohol dehydrogenase family)|nr:SDR family oxidoreductase [Steroidobacter sp.]
MSSTQQTDAKPQPAQRQQHQPGEQTRMTPEPVSIRNNYRGSGKLEGRVALISGGDSGIGRAVAVHFAREGAAVAIIYLEEGADAKETQRLAEAEGAECLLLQGDVSDSAFCKKAVTQTVERFGALDVLVNNAGQQFPAEAPENISEENLERTFRVNVFGYMFLTQAALEHLAEQGCIINTGSITGVRGNRKLVDYSAAKGAIQAMTYSLAQQLIERGIRVNGVAPGPVWTPLIPASFSKEEVAKFGADNPMKRPAQPCEVAPAYVFLASQDASYINGQFIHVNGGSYMH